MPARNLDVNYEEAYQFYLEVRSINKVQSKYKQRKEILKSEWNKLGYQYPVKRQYIIGRSIDHPMKVNKNLKANFFQNIDSEEKAYFLGLFAADGSIDVRKCPNRGNSYRATLSLKQSDDYLLEYFRKQINQKTTLKYAAPKTVNMRNKEYYSQGQASINIYSKVFVNHLIDQGIVPNKTYVSVGIPSFEEKLIPHYMRGYFDGNGCIGIYKEGKHIRCYIVAKRDPILSFFHEILLSKKIDCFIRCYDGLYYLEIRQRSVLDFWYYIEPINTDCSLRRKRDLFNEIRTIKEKSLNANSVNSGEACNGNPEPSPVEIPGRCND
jgi:hypothetical protein